MNPNRHLKVVAITPANPLHNFTLPNMGKDAACKTADPDIFFGENLAEIAEAKSICAGCPALSRCRDYAVTNEEFGIWGGTTPAERNKLRKGAKVQDPQQARLLAENQDLLFSNNHTVRQIADFFGVVPRTIYRWRKEARGDHELGQVS